MDLGKVKYGFKRRLRRLAALPRKAVTYAGSTRRKSDGPPIFILGCPRSGTTLVRKIVNCHSRIACPGETYFLGPMLEQRTNPDFRASLEGIDFFKEEVLKNVREYALNIYESYLHRAGKARWADKTPTYTLYGHAIVELFNRDVQFVYCMRHGMDCVNSMKNERFITTDVPPNSPLEVRLKRGAEMWLKYTKTYNELVAAYPEVIHTVRYEDLTRDPETVMRGVFDFLGEEWEPGTLDYQAYPHGGAGDPKSVHYDGIVTANSHKFMEWPPELRQKIYEMMRPELERHGYAVDEAALRDESPSAR